MNICQAELPLFGYENSQEEVTIPEVKIVQPLSQVINHITPNPTREPSQKLQNTPTFVQSLDELFPEQKYDEKNIQRAKEALGSVAYELTPEQLKDTVSEVEYLCESWLDEFERGIFNGLTLREVLHEKGRS